MSHIVIITGGMRSGTSAVAQMAHRMGFLACAVMTPPQPPRWHQDWEDFEALTTLMKLWPHGAEISNRTLGAFAVWFDGYARRRLRGADGQKQMGADWIRGVAMKSPLYAPFIPSMIYHCGALDITPTVIVCDRDREDRRASNRVANEGVDPEDLERMENTIDRALESIKPDLRIRFEDLLANPADVGAILATALGVDSGEGEDIGEAVINTRTWA